MKVQPITDEQAAAIAGWRYEFPYEWYDTSADPRRIELFANPARRTHLRAVVDDNGELVGFFNFVPEGHEVRLGLGMRPDLTGHGFAQPFIAAGLDYARAQGLKIVPRCSFIAAFIKRNPEYAASVPEAYRDAPPSCEIRRS